MTITYTTKDAYDLFHEGQIAFSQMESNGMRIDVPRLNKTIKKVEQRIIELSAALKKDDVWKLWRRRFGQNTNMNSRPQLGVILFEEMEYKIKYRTATGKPSVDAEALSKVKLPFVKQYLEIGKLKKLLSTNLKGVQRFVVNGYLHPSFNLNLVKTYRGSSSDINFQNIPIRDKLIGKLVRSCFIPSDNHVLAEVDFSSMEFRCGACHWNDPELVKYASDPELDIHRDMAAECFAMPLDQVTPEARFFAKNQFVFPQFYGSYYVPCAKNLWSAAGGLTLKDGQSVRENLATQKITRTNFESHIKKVEEHFHARFPIWLKKKDAWWNDYVRRGWFDMVTGFRVHGVYSRNQLMNFPVQGPAFHALLLSLILINKWLLKNKMRSKIIGQIHDSIVFDIHSEEQDGVLQKTKQVMTEEIRELWKWLVVPLDVDVEVSETNWYEKEAIKC